MKAKSFNGETNYNVYAVQFKNVARYNDWDETQKRDELLNALEGKATKILQCMPHLQDDTTTFQQLHEALEKTYGRHITVWERINKFQSLKQGEKESLQDFSNNVSWDDMTVFKSYDTLLPAVMCNPAGEECFARKCVVCKNYSDNLRSVLDEVLGDTVTFSRWEKVSKKSQLISRQDSKENFCDLFLQSVCDLAWHDFLARMQQSALWHLKCDMPPGHVLVCADFAENYSFTIQNSVQGFHWNNSQATVHPFVCYFGSEGKIQHLSFVVISNCKDHNSLTVYVFQKKLIAFLKEKFPVLHKLIYFTDGCAAQYKNFKSLKNLCEHKSDFGLDAEWHFYATSHGKSACDGVGGTVKREARHACLQSPFQNLIGTPRELFQWCVTKMTGTHFCYVDQEDIEKERLFFETRTGKCSTLTGTMNYHFFRPTGTPNQLECKLYSASTRPDLRTVPTKASK
ncbi:hypothetical protein FOCC_FOCC015744 [Frankliniella occidentalis]|nr:hypothetical protein FOCC_FOCC015744 [Frankliniella occidentalis]